LSFLIHPTLRVLLSFSEIYETKYPSADFFSPGEIRNRASSILWPRFAGTKSGQHITMKKNIHPSYFPKSKVKCACGNKFTVGSTKESIEVEICNTCHPFFTGKEKLVDTAGRVEKFKARLSKKVSTKTAKKTRKTNKK